MTTCARLSAGAVSAVLVITLAGCSDSSPSANPDPSDGSASSPTDSPTDSPTEPPVALANGKLIENDYFSLRAPKGFVYEKLTDLTSSLFRAATGDAIFFSFLTGVPEMSLDELADLNLSGSSATMTPERVADTEIDGLPVWHATGPISEFKVDDVYGLWIDGAAVSVAFSTLPSGEKRRKLIETILSTWTWK